MIPTSPDWRKIVLELRRRLGSDEAVAAAALLLESRSAISYLATGRHKSPRWALGAALLNLHAEGR